MKRTKRKKRKNRKMARLGALGGAVGSRAQAAAARRNGMKGGRPRLDGRPPSKSHGHGTRGRYARGCRCPRCTAANRDYMRRWSTE